MYRIKKYIKVTFLGFLLAAGSASASTDFPLLRQSYDPGLQHLLDNALMATHLMKAVRADKLAVALVNLDNLHQPRVAQVNGNQMMYAASLPKIGILLTAFVEVEDGQLQMTSRLHGLLTKMIRYSNNAAATTVMNLVGKRRVNQVLESPQFHLYNPATNGGIWVGKTYGKAPAFQRDPLHNISQGATPMQVARFYYLMETDRLVNPRLTAEMKEVMSKPGIYHKFVKGLAGRKATIYRKSGTWHQYHADSMLVETPRGKYILVALADDRHGGDWMVRLAPAVHDRLFPPSMADSTTKHVASAR